MSSVNWTVLVFLSLGVDSFPMKAPAASFGSRKYYEGSRNALQNNHFHQQPQEALQNDGLHLEAGGEQSIQPAAFRSERIQYAINSLVKNGSTTLPSQSPSHTRTSLGIFFFIATHFMKPFSFLTSLKPSSASGALTLKICFRYSKASSDQRRDVVGCDCRNHFPQLL